MKTMLPMPETKPSTPSRTIVDALMADTLDGASSFVFTYPLHTISGRASEVVTGLIQVWTARGYTVKTSATGKAAVRDAKAGEAWIIWAKGGTALHVFGRRPVAPAKS